jgi:membrane-associated phospholipid phosphatase
MTTRAAASDRVPAAAPAPEPDGIPERSLAGLLASPRGRLGAGAIVVAVTALAVRRRGVSPWEASAFRAVNSLPSSVYPAAWACMQLGAFGAVPATAGAAWLAGDRGLAGRLLVGGAGTWALAKLVKQAIRRPRPAVLLPGTRCRGRPAAGLGYLSGHAGVAAALGAAAIPRLGPGGRALVLIAVPAVGLTRVYAGAHLPLDIAGGTALGLAVDAAVTLAAGRPAGGGRGPRSGAAARRAPGMGVPRRDAGQLRGRPGRPSGLWSLHAAPENCLS